MSPKPSTDLYLGTAGWSYPDWAGFFYPASQPHDFSELAFLSRYVSAAEVNMSFYRIPDPGQVERWLRAVEARPRFMFSMKLWRGFTHDPGAIVAADARTFDEAADRLAQSGRLAGVLAQFPWSFRYGEAQIDRLKELADRFGAWRLIVEVRHGSWMREEFFDLLERLDCSFCNIDQPVIGRSVPPTAIVTASPAYARLHGRRYDTWFAEDSDVARRYDYLYKTNELEEWARRIREIMPKAERTLVIANNHFNAKAVAATLELQSILSGHRPPAPPELLNAYPRLKRACVVDPAIAQQGIQLDLFRR
jgi:uncharacterized protein YecE (DUF72 family)